MRARVHVNPLTVQLKRETPLREHDRRINGLSLMCECSVTRLEIFTNLFAVEFSYRRAVKFLSEQARGEEWTTKSGRDLCGGENEICVSFVTFVVTIRLS